MYSIYCWSPVVFASSVVGGVLSPRSPRRLYSRVRTLRSQWYGWDGT